MLYIHGIGHFHPENVLDNAFLERLEIGTDDGWILERVGIHARRTVLPLDYIETTRNRDPRAAAEASLYSNAETGARAARMAIERAGIAVDDVGMVVAGGCSPQWSIPAEACLVAAELGIEAPCFDLSSACSTFVAQLLFLANSAADTLPDYVLIVQPENNTRTVNYDDRNTAVLWGDCSAAAVLSQRRPSSIQVRSTSLHSDPSGWRKVRIPAGGHFEQDGRAVQGFAIRKTTIALTALQQARGGNNDDLLFVGHQANLLMLQAACRRAGIPPQRHLSNVERFGNCGAAGAPSVLSEHWDELGEGANVGLVVVGSGLTWGGTLIEFAEGV